MAAAKADLVIVTDDNPRSEDPAAIRRAILAAAPGAIEIGDRATAINEAIARLERGDVLLVAGKGHETGQTVGATVIPFSDHDAVAAALKQEASVAEPLWTLGEIVERHARAPASARARRPSRGFSIDSRSLARARASSPFAGRTATAMLSSLRRLMQGAACAIVDGTFPPGDEERLLRVEDTLEALNDLGRASRARATDTKVIAVTGSAGKTGTKEALSLRSHPAARCTPRPSRSTIIGACRSRSPTCRETRRFGVFEIGMNHAGEIDALSGWSGRTSPSSPRSRRCISASSARSRRSPTPRRKSSTVSSPAALRSSIATIRISSG